MWGVHLGVQPEHGGHLDEQKPSENDSKKTSLHHLKTVAMDGSTRVLMPEHLQELRRSGLSDPSIESSGVYSAGQKQISALIGWTWRKGHGLVFPHYDARGNLMLSRVKPDEPRHIKQRGSHKVMKYEHPKGKPAVPYYPLQALQEKRYAETDTWVWTEGEKKALLLCQLGYAPVGLGGVHNFCDAQKRSQGEGMVWSSGLLELVKAHGGGKRHVICFDADAFSNKHVMLAARRLGGMLLADGAREVRMVKIPAAEDGKTGIDDYCVTHGESETRALIEAAALVEEGGEIEPLDPQNPLLPLSSLPWLRGAKLPPGLRLPPRWDIRKDRSVWFQKSPDGDPVELLKDVLIPMGRLQSEDEGHTRIEFVYRAYGKWLRGSVLERSLRDARKALDALPAGAPIDSNCARDQVQWCSDFLRVNQSLIEKRHVLGRTGWFGAGFSLGADVLGRDDVRCELPESGPSVSVAFKPRGELEGHREAIKQAFDTDPICAMAILGALGAPLLRKLGAPNFTMHFFGDSSRGKTSMLKIAASVYGDPESAAWVSSGNTTMVAMEQRAQMLTDMPFFMDELGAGDLRQMEQRMYMMGSGVGRSRANKMLEVRKMTVFHGILMSSGELEIVAQNSATGAQVRALQLHVRGFGELDGFEIDALRVRCAANAAHLGRDWLQIWVSERDEWSMLELFYRETCKEFRELAGQNPLLGRQSGMFAFLATVEHASSAFLGVGQPQGETVRQVFKDSSAHVTVRSLADRATDMLAEWVATELWAFPELSIDMHGGGKLSDVVPGRRISGIRRPGEVCFYPEAMKAKFTEQGMPPGVTLRCLADQGKIILGGQKVTRQVRVGGARHRMICIPEEHLGFDIPV